MKDKTDKFRYFAFFVYRHDKDGNEIHSLEEIVNRLHETHAPFVISPMHSPDDEHNDEHWHIVYKHPNSVSFEGARKYLISVAGGMIFNDFILPLHHPRGYQRYLLHLDDPEKEQFPDGLNEIRIINNFPLDLSRELSRPEMMQMQIEIEYLAVDYAIFEYSDMTLYLAKHNMMDHYMYFTSHTHHFGKFLDSLRYKHEKVEDLDY